MPAGGVPTTPPATNAFLALEDDAWIGGHSFRPWTMRP
jgi:hypothetical protein